jgi:hypothetical protein
MAKATHPELKPRKFSIEIDDYEEAVEFRKGLILAKQNNSSPYFPALIDAVNAILKPYEDALVEAQKDGVGPNAKVELD